MKKKLLIILFCLWPMIADFACAMEVTGAADTVEKELSNDCKYLLARFDECKNSRQALNMFFEYKSESDFRGKLRLGLAVVGELYDRQDSVSNRRIIDNFFKSLVVLGQSDQKDKQLIDELFESCILDNHENLEFVRDEIRDFVKKRPDQRYDLNKLISQALRGHWLRVECEDLALLIFFHAVTICAALAVVHFTV